MDHAHADTAPHASPTSGGAFGQASSAETFAESLHDFLIRVDASGARQMLLENEIEDVATLRMASEDDLTRIGLTIGTALKIVTALAGACSSPSPCPTCFQSLTR
jgi:hypothetical protein